MTFVRELVTENDLLIANSFVDIAYEVGYVAGTGFAGLIMSYLSIPACFFVNALCYCAAVLLLCFKHHSKRSREIRQSIWAQFVLGWQYIKKRPLLLIIYLVQTLFFISYMTTPVLLAPYAKNILHTNLSQFGWMEGILSIGIIVGSMISPWLANKLTINNVIILYLLIGSMGFFLFSHTNSINHAIIYNALIGCSFSNWALIATLAQEMTDIHYQGRVQALFNALSGVLIIAFYYVMTTWDQSPLSSLYSVEIFIFAIAILLMSYLKLHKLSR